MSDDKHSCMPAQPAGGDSTFTCRTCGQVYERGTTWHKVVTPRKAKTRFVVLDRRDFLREIDYPDGLAAVPTGAVIRDGDGSIAVRGPNRWLTVGTAVPMIPALPGYLLWHPNWEDKS